MPAYNTTCELMRLMMTSQITWPSCPLLRVVDGNGNNWRVVSVQSLNEAVISTRNWNICREKSSATRRCGTDKAGRLHVCHTRHFITNVTHVGQIWLISIADRLLSSTDLGNMWYFPDRFHTLFLIGNCIFNDNFVLLNCLCVCVCFCYRMYRSIGTIEISVNRWRTRLMISHTV